MGKIAHNKHTIDKINLSNKLDGLKSLVEYLERWRKKNSEIFRIDGHHSIGPANPAQHIFFEINDFIESDYNGFEFQKEINGTVWNGFYYLTASTQGKAIDYLIEQYHLGKSSAEIFDLTYTKGKRGVPSKRRLELKNASDEINKGWFCKQYVKRY
ncbi:hypothetical protein [Halobacteriovorax sp. DPLXC-1]|uniref:hypothetical protein n=1 Tax=Halobacteriovorax sp. DPLXC-1 TaxID=3110771 RepID=UPI002FF1BE3F